MRPRVRSTACRARLGLGPSLSRVDDPGFASEQAEATCPKLEGHPTPHRHGARFLLPHLLYREQSERGIRQTELTVTMQETMACPPSERPASAAVPLSQHLRDGTRQVHTIVEAKLGLPQTVACRDDYIAFLRRSYRLYRPLEDHLLAFPDWPDHGIRLAEQSLVACLASDLSRLQPGVSLPFRAPAEACPHLPSFAHALGALYVLKGSTLGGEVILRHLIQAEIAGAATACAFLGAGRTYAGGTWPAFRALLDRYGWERPEAVPHVMAGATRSFDAIGEWMQSTRWRET